MASDWPKDIPQIADMNNGEVPSFRVYRLHLMYHHDYRQQSGEFIDDFMARVRIIADKCQFKDDELNERLIELIIYNTPHKGLREELLAKPAGYSVKDALEECLKYEARSALFEGHVDDLILQAEEIQDSDYEDQDVLLTNKAITSSTELCSNIKKECVSNEEIDNADEMPNVKCTSGENIKSPSEDQMLLEPKTEMEQNTDLVSSQMNMPNIPESDPAIENRMTCVNTSSDSSWCTKRRSASISRNSMNKKKLKKTRKAKVSHKCDTCGKCFDNVEILSKHIKTHKCDVCGKYLSCSLSVHMRMHTGEKPYTCDVCGKSCRQSGGLVLHKRTHTGEKPHKCKICSKTFTGLNGLSMHSVIHTGKRPYECGICGQKFTCASHRLRHMKIHTGEKEHNCEVCGKKFIQASNMRKHMRTHTGEKPYECTVCGTGYAASTTLNAHMRTHTGETLQV